MAEQRRATADRERRTLDAVILASGAEQAIDFVLPLFAGSVLGLTAWQTGALIAASQLAALLFRPLAGVFADRGNRAVIAAVGAAAFGAGCGLYALSSGPSLAFVAAAVTGSAGAFLWVAVRSIIGERLAEDSTVYAKLFAAEETGGWLVLIPAIALLAVAGHQLMFAALAVCSLVAAWLLFTARRLAAGENVSQHASTAPLRALVASLRPMLLAVTITMAAEAAIGLLLILHLQREFGLGVLEVAYVFLPGAIAMSVLPPHMHRLVVRFGRRRLLIVASLTSSLFAAGLAFAPSPPSIALLWVLSAVAWSAIMPVQQSVIAEASGASRLGRALGLYETACLLGALVGSLAAGLLYDTGRWMLVCLICALLIASGTLFLPAAVKRLGATNFPAGASPRAPGRGPHKADREPDSAGPTTTLRKPRKPRQKLMSEFAWHSGLLAVALLVAWLTLPGFEMSTMIGVGGGVRDLRESLRGLFASDIELGLLAMSAMRVWVVIYCTDFAWTLWQVFTPERHTRPARDG